MSLEYERASKQLPILGTAAAATMDGTVFTPWLDTNTYGCKALTFVANISAVATYAASGFVVQESDDGGTTSNAVPDDLLVAPEPVDTSLTSKVFHVGVLSKKRYVRAAFASGGAQTGQITAIFEHPMSAPIFPTS